MRDYMHVIQKQAVTFIYRKPPKHYLDYIEDGKQPIILIPGIYEKWQFLKEVSDPLSQQGHPVYAIENLGYNIETVDDSAKLIHEFILEKKLENVIIISHSKGGLIGKYLLTYFNAEGRIKKLIAIASPFSGSNIVKYIPLPGTKELHPESEMLRKLTESKQENRLIVSICGTYDNHVWPETSCFLDGAKNIQVKAHGHHQMLAHKDLKQTVIQEVELVM